MADWHDFFVAQAGVAGALIGLLFVAVSINLARILQFPQLPTRAVEALVLFFLVLVVATLALVPGQSLGRLGAELLATGGAAWVLQLSFLIRTREADRRYARRSVRIVLNQLPPVPFLLAGAGMLAGDPGAGLWLMPGTLLCFGAGVFGAWVLLVEIHR